MHSFHHRLALLASVAGAAFAWPAAAQQGPAAAVAAPEATQADGGQSGAGHAASNSEIVVVGTRAQATDLQLRSAAPISVLSNEDLQHTAVHNVAEALGLMPSVNVMNTGSSFFGGIDGASRGEGMFVSIRGLNAEYNVNLINGVNVAQGMPYSRQVQLSLLPPSGLNTIVLNKVSTADMDGDAIGGTVDFRTPSAFDFGKPLHLAVTASGRLETRARDYGDSGLGGGVSGEVARRFADGSLGIYASAYYDERHYANSEMAGLMAAQNDNGWSYITAQKVTDAKGNSSYQPYPGLDPQQNVTQTGFNVGVSNGYTVRWGGNASLDWRPDDGTQIYLRGTYAYAKTKQNSTFSQFTSSSKSYVNTNPATDRYTVSVDAISTREWLETNPEVATLATAALGMVKQTGGWTIEPQLFFSEGHNNRPDHIEASARINQSDKFNSGKPRPLGGTSIVYRDDLPRPQLTPDILADFNDPGSRLLARRAGQLTQQFSGQSKWGGRLDLERKFDDSVLASIKFGAKYSDSTRNVTNRDWTNDHFANNLGKGGVTWNDLGLISGYYDQAFPGVYTWKLAKVNEAKLREYFHKYQGYNGFASFDSCDSDYSYTDNYNCNTQRGKEAVTSAYAMAHIQAGGVELIPGIRFEHTAIRNTYWVLPADKSKTGNWESNRTRYDEFLPSLLVNYRPSDNAVYRGSLWWSYTRPPFVQLGGGARYSVSDDGNVTITKGNPDLKPVRSLNADVSAEWKIAPGGYVSLGGYYKHLRNYLYDNGSGYVNSLELTGGTVHTIIPQNGGSGDVYGVELQFRKKFVEAPGLLGGLGIGGSVTRQWTTVDIGGGIEKRIQNAPQVMGDAQIFWEKGGLSVDLIYHYTGEYVAGYGVLGLKTWDDLWVRPVQTVDLHAGYDFGGGVRADLSVANLFGARSYWAHVGRDTLAISDVVDSGTTGLFTLKFAF